MKYYLAVVILLLACLNIGTADNATWTLPFPDLSTKPQDDNSIVPGLTANVNGQTIYNISKNIWMGLAHPTLWDNTHCIQVPYFANAIQRMNQSSKACQPITGWYFNAKGNGNCVSTTVPCSALPTLNLFATQEDCQSICFFPNGTGIKLIPTNVNLDPRITCNDKPIITLGTSIKQKLVWAYDAITQTCWEFFIPADTATTFNIYKDGAVCQHMCHDVAPPGSGLGHSLATPDMSMMDMSQKIGPTTGSVDNALASVGGPAGKQIADTSNTNDGSSNPSSSNTDAENTPSASISPAPITPSPIANKAIPASPTPAPSGPSSTPTKPSSAANNPTLASSSPSSAPSTASIKQPKSQNQSTTPSGPATATSPSPSAVTNPVPPVTATLTVPSPNNKTASTSQKPSKQNPKVRGSSTTTATSIASPASTMALQHRQTNEDNESTINKPNSPSSSALNMKRSKKQNGNQVVIISS